METSASQSLNLRRKIRVVRRLKGYSQEYMAIKMGISQNAYSKMERGKIRLAPERILNISKLLGMEPYNISRIRETDLTFANPVLPSPIEILAH